MWIIFSSLFLNCMHVPVKYQALTNEIQEADVSDVTFYVIPYVICIVFLIWWSSSSIEKLAGIQASDFLRNSEVPVASDFPANLTRLLSDE